VVDGKWIIRNKKAGYDYFLMESFEAGIELRGTEVKSLRLGKVNFQDAYVSIDQNFEAWIYNLHIGVYDFGNIHNHEETRKRKLLLHRKEIIQLLHRQKTEGLNLIPVGLYFKNSKVKAQISLAKGKKNYDKRQAIAEKEMSRKIKQKDYDI